MSNPTLDYLVHKFQIDPKRPSPIEVQGSRWQELIDILSDLNFKTGAEIGVEQGRYSEALCQKITGLKLFCIDPWQSYRRYGRSVSQAKLDRFFVETQIRLGPYNCQIIKKPSQEAVLDFHPETLDFVYIDGNHEFEYIVNDIINWSKIVRPGGIMAGHDYKPDETGRYPFHVIQATRAYTSAHHIYPWLVLHGDTAPSWLWVKP